MNVLHLLAQPPPPGGVPIPTGSELLMAGLLIVGGVWMFWRTDRRRGLRYAALFAALAAAFYVVVPEQSALQMNLDRVTLHGFSWGPAMVLSALGTPATVEGTSIVTADGPMAVVRGCLGWSYLSLFVMAVAVYPTSWLRRLTAIVVGALVHGLMNVGRVVLLHELWQDESYFAFEAIHRGGGLYFTAVLLAVFGLAVWPRREALAALPSRRRARRWRLAAAVVVLVGAVWSLICYGQSVKHLSWRNGWLRAQASGHPEATPEAVEAAVANNARLAGEWAAAGSPGLMFFLCGGIAVLALVPRRGGAVHVSPRYLLVEDCNAPRGMA